MKIHDSKFRTWLHELWLQNSDELRDWGSDPYTPAEYFQRNKWWLRGQYRQRQRQNTQ
jgi:hypothetical protein